MSQTSETVLEIDLAALEHDYKYMRSKISATTKILGVVKAFAYGSDAVKIATRLEKLGADYFAVAYTKEGITLREGGITKPILVLHPQSSNFEELIQQRLMPNIYSKHTLEIFIDTAEKLQQKNYPIHLKINTGLNRLGFSYEELEWVLEKLNSTNSTKIEGVFSHLGASEDAAEKDFTLFQIENYQKAIHKILPQLKNKPICHLCNTSGIINYPEAHYDMVRTGIGLYGYGNSAEEDRNLIPVGTLKTLISQIHHIKKGESVGYNRGFIASKNTLTATLPIGHADGINRIYGKEKTDVLINGERAPIIGNVCMDMLMVDVTNIDCKEGDEVILFGKEKSAEEFANNAGTISYELVTSISQRVKRNIIN